MFSPLFRSLCVVSLLSMLLPLQAPSYAEFNPENNLQQWSMVTIKGNIQKKVLGYFEAQSRVNLAGPKHDNVRDYQMILIRPAVGYQITKHISLWQGYGWTPAINPRYRNEDRLFQQLLIENKYKHWSMTNRTRLEERFIDDASTSFRGRHMLRAMVPIGKSKKWSVAAYDEFFYNFNDAKEGPKSGFDQNRIFLGLNRKIGTHTNIEFGYLNQYVSRPEPKSDRLNHALFAGLNYNIN